MIEVDGKQVLTEISELVDPAHTALVVIDMQHDFVDPAGLFAQSGIDVSAYAPLRLRLSELLEHARSHGLLVVHVQNTALPGGRSDSPAQIRFAMRLHDELLAGGPPLRYTVPGTPGHAFLPELTPAPGEVVVRKYRSSGFWGTNLDMVLRSNAIKTVVIAGCTTEGCVDSTARDALFGDYYVVIASDCVASDDAAQHDAAMLVMAHRFDMAAAHELAGVWASAREHVPAGVSA